MREVPPDSRTRRRLAGALLVLLAALAVAFAVVPLWVIRPWVSQTREGLALAYQVRRWAPLATALTLAAGLGLTVWLWRGARWWSRTALVLALVVLTAAVWRARQNPAMFETMFVPLGNARFAPAAEVDWVAPGEPVLAVERNGEAVAFPVRQLAYHHIVQEVVGGVPVAATY
jgi:Protein of unknown function (DUF3179)